VTPIRLADERMVGKEAAAIGGEGSQLSFGRARGERDSEEKKRC